MSEFKTISEVADQLQLPQHVLRFWETQFSQIKPAKRRGGRRFYAQQDLETLQKIQNLLYVKGYTIKGAKKALNQNFMPFGISAPISAPPVQKQQETKQADLFAAMEKPITMPVPTAENKDTLKRILGELKEAEKLLHS